MDKLTENLKFLRAHLDVEADRSNIDEVLDKAMKLSSLVGLAAEAKAQARKALELKRLQTLQTFMNQGLQASILTKLMDGHCAHELAQLEYADRLNAGISNAMDTLRSVISLYKEELSQGHV